MGRKSGYLDLQHRANEYSAGNTFKSVRAGSSPVHGSTSGAVQDCAVAAEIEEIVRRRAGELGLEVASVEIRDVILSVDMKDLMNKVTDAKKAAETNLIARREETVAMRSQANTAKVLADNPTLMRLRELEVLKKIATAGNLNVVLGEKGLADRVVNLL